MSNEPVPAPDSLDFPLSCSRRLDFRAFQLLCMSDSASSPTVQSKALLRLRSTLGKRDFIELVVDGNIVDLNRIPLPADTPIIDERFKDGQKK